MVVCKRAAISKSNNFTEVSNSAGSDATPTAEDINSSETSQPKKKRRTKDEHFISDYEANLKNALTKLQASANLSIARFSKKDCCILLWRLFGDFHRDTEKDFDAKGALNKAIQCSIANPKNEHLPFRAEIDYALDDMSED